MGTLWLCAISNCFQISAFDNKSRHIQLIQVRKYSIQFESRYFLIMWLGGIETETSPPAGIETKVLVSSSPEALKDSSSSDIRTKDQRVSNLLYCFYSGGSG